MSNYTKTTDFEVKDSLPSGDPGKIIKGTEFEVEFDAISASIATKADQAGPTFTGTATFGAVNVTGSFTSLGIDDNGISTAITIDATNDVAITNDLTVDTDTLVVDSTNNTVGIGTNNPVNALVVSDGDDGFEFRTNLTDDNRILSFNRNTTAYTKMSLDAASFDLRIAGAAPSVVLDSSGNVGIGTTSPSFGLDVVAANNSQLRIDSSDAADTTLVMDYNGTGSADRIRLRNANGDFALNVNNTLEAMRIDSSGNVGIGAAPVATSYSGTNTTTYIANSSAAALTLDSTGGSGRAMSLISSTAGALDVFDEDAGLIRMRIDSSGNLGVGETTPARKLHVGDAMRLQPIASAPSTPAAGDLYFDSTLNKLRCYDGTAWQDCF